MVCGSAIYSDTKGVNSFKRDSGSQIPPTGLISSRNFMFCSETGVNYSGREINLFLNDYFCLAQLQVFAAW